VGEAQRKRDVYPDQSPSLARTHQEPFMLKSALIAAAALAMLSSNLALANKVRHHPAHANSHAAPTVNHAPPYDWQAGDCDVANKTTLNTCSNGGR
jgi:hypothetical protein